MKFSTEKLISNKGNLIDGPIHVIPNVILDERGFFFESWNANDWRKILETHDQPYVSFVQDNHSCSARGILRGLHYQSSPHGQGKLVRCTSGEVFDVAVDIRKDSNTFSEWVAVYLNPSKSNQLWIPEGFAHGFLSLEEKTEINYKVTDYWSKECEGSIAWNDSDLNIYWPLEKINEEKLSLSKKDNEAPSLKEIFSK